MTDGRKLRVAVLFGGRSAEHEISLLSARFVVEALDRDRFEPVLIGIDKEGRWLLQEEALLLGASRDPRLARLNAAMPSVSLAAHPAARGEAALSVVGRAAEEVDVVFPVLHGPMGEDGAVQGLLELAGLPYVGSGVLGSAVGMDKDVMKRLLAEAEIPIVKHVTLRLHACEKSPRGALDRCEEALGYPVFVKPANLGSSVGVSRAKNREELARAIEHAFEFDEKVVVRRGRPGRARDRVCGPRRRRAGRLDSGRDRRRPSRWLLFVCGEVRRRDRRDGRDPGRSHGRGDQCRSAPRALRTFRALEGSGLARVDFFRAASGKLYVNEINTLPGFTAISMYPKLWAASGVGSKELVARLVDLALARAARQKQAPNEPISDLSQKPVFVSAPCRGSPCHRAAPNIRFSVSEKPCPGTIAPSAAPPIPNGPHSERTPNRGRKNARVTSKSGKVLG